MLTFSQSTCNCQLQLSITHRNDLLVQELVTHQVSSEHKWKLPLKYVRILMHVPALCWLFITEYISCWLSVICVMGIPLYCSWRGDLSSFSQKSAVLGHSNIYLMWRLCWVSNELRRAVQVWWFGLLASQVSCTSIGPAKTYVFIIELNFL